ncbi:transmembrane protein 255B isoform X2 [Scleropages formosus]|uniref:transmembrane protein 255B isoform X2 n=1 Tax=Scleropages formosus TaxID=113540 RepID=UPI000878D5AF|nr:transmembrane protein 255B isoform X2 [Scleropages formosus]
MQQPPAVPSSTAVPEPAEQFSKRRRTALWFTAVLLFLSIIILVVGLVSATRTGSVAVAGYYPGVILSFGAFLGIVGIYLVENRRPMLVASIIFVSIGVIASFLCAIVDGIIAAEFIDIRPLMENRCEFYSSDPGHFYESYQSEMTCYSFKNKCKIRVKSNTCYCCDLYNCESPDYNVQYYMFTHVNSCSDVVHLYRLLWSSVVLNVLGLFLGIVTAAILGAFKDMASTPQTCPSPAPPPHILYNPAQHVLTYAGFCPSSQSMPAYPNYPLPLQHPSSYQPPSAALPGTEGPTSPSEESQSPSQPISQASSSYMLTPNAPAFYGTSYGPCEKPPPYAC